MEEMTRKQPDVDKVTKTYKRRAADPASLQSHIPVLDKGRAGSKQWLISLIIIIYYFFFLERENVRRERGRGREKVS